MLQKIRSRVARYFLHCAREDARKAIAYFTHYPPDSFGFEKGEIYARYALLWRRIGVAIEQVEVDDATDNSDIS